jgi:hypothetical protein
MSRFGYQLGVPCPDPNLPAGLTQEDVEAAYGRSRRRGRTEEEEMDRADYLNDLAKDELAEKGIRP